MSIAHYLSYGNITCGFTTKYCQGINIETELAEISNVSGVGHYSAVYLKQEHKDNVVAISRDMALNVSNVFVGDALVSDHSGVLLSVRTADCIPVFICDRAGNGIGVVHAGWRSASMGLLLKSIDLMNQNFSVLRENMIIIIGPGLRKECFEVREDFFANDVFSDFIEEKEGRFFLDLKQFLLVEAVRAGVDPYHIVDTGICTLCDDNLYSYRGGDKDNRIINFIYRR